MAIFTGAGVAIVTPFNDDEERSINYDKLDALLDYHCNNWDSAFYSVNCKLYALHMFFFCHCCRLASCSTDYNTICSIIAVVIKQCIWKYFSGCKDHVSDRW